MTTNTASQWPQRLWSILSQYWALIIATAIALVALVNMWRPDAIAYFREHASSFEKFTLILFLVMLLPPLVERLRLPGAVGLLFGGVLLGPYVFAIVPPDAPVLDLVASVGRVFLMFTAGLEIDMRVFNATRNRSIGFGAMTFTFPLLCGIGAALCFGFAWVAALLIGSLIASHTLLGFPIVNKLGLGKSEPVAVTVGATIFTDIASLLVLAVCISIHQGGFSLMGLGIQLISIAIFAVIVLQGLPLLGHIYFHHHRENEQALFIFTFFIVMVAAVGAHLIHLEDIVGAFLAGIAVNRLLERSPVRAKVIMMGEGLFIPLFFMAIGIRLNLPVFGATLLNSLWFVVAITAALLVGKFLATVVTRWFYGYDWPATLTMWSLSLPQVAATLAAAIAAYDAVNAEGDRLITESVLNAVIVLMVLTAILGPVLTERFGSRMTSSEEKSVAIP